MKKGAIPIETIAVLVVAVLVVIIIVMWVTGYFTKAGGTINPVEAQAKFNQECTRLLPTNCNNCNIASTDKIVAYCEAWLCPGESCSNNTDKECHPYKIEKRCGCNCPLNR